VRPINKRLPALQSGSAGRLMPQTTKRRDEPGLELRRGIDRSQQRAVASRSPRRLQRPRSVACGMSSRRSPMRASSVSLIAVSVS